VPFLWILEVLRACEKAPWHTYLFLTKNPHRYVSIQRVESRYRKLWPDNCWLGVTVTNQEDADKRIPELWEADCRTIFVSAEPVLGPIHLPRPPDYSPGDPSLGLSWLIIGAMTGPKAIRPKVDWVNSLVIQAKSAGIPIFVKNNLNVLCYGHFMTHRDFPG
jgi:protein gp37